MDNQTINYLADICSALAHPVRLRIVALLSENSKSVNDITTSLDMAQGAVSGHLRILKQAKLVDCERTGSKNIYSLTGPNIESIKKLIER